MAKFKVTMTEISRFGVHTLEQIAVCESERDVIKFYGLDEPHISDHKIETISDYPSAIELFTLQ